NGCIWRSSFSGETAATGPWKMFMKTTIVWNWRVGRHGYASCLGWFTKDDDDQLDRLQLDEVENNEEMQPKELYFYLDPARPTDEAASPAYGDLGDPLDV
ncbi:hypothetical protein FOZ62_031149, partial [Perkinsus olseni]